MGVWCEWWAGCGCLVKVVGGLWEVAMRMVGWLWVVAMRMVGVGGVDGGRVVGGGGEDGGRVVAGGGVDSERIVGGCRSLWVVLVNRRLWFGLIERVGSCG